MYYVAFKEYESLYVYSTPIYNDDVLDCFSILHEFTASRMPVLFVIKGEVVFEYMNRITPINKLLDDVSDVLRYGFGYDDDELEHYRDVYDKLRRMLEV